MSYSSTILLDSPIAYYRLGEASGTGAVDSTGGTFNGTYNSVTYGTSGAILGDSNTAVSFNGTSSYIALPVSLNPGGWTAFSIEAWINIPNTTFTGNPRICSNSHTDVDHSGFQWFLNNGAGGSTFTIGNGGTATAATTTFAFAVNKWYHMAVTYDGSNIRSYINGALISTTPATTIQNTAAQAINIGRGVPYNGDYWPGSLDEVAFYHSVLSQAQIKNHIVASLLTNSVSVTELTPATETIRAIRVQLLSILELSGSSGRVYTANATTYVVEPPSSSGITSQQTIIVSAPDAQMQASDLAIQYARIRASAINPAVRIIAKTYYGSSVNSAAIQGELDTLLYGEKMNQLHVMRTINDVTNFLQSYSYQAIVLNDSPEAYYRLGEASGSSVSDATAKYGAGTLSASGVMLGVTGAISGNPGTAATFNGAGFITLPGALNTAGWTGLSLECWVKASAAPASYTRIVASDSPNASKQGIELLLAPNSDGSMGYWNIGEGVGSDGMAFGTTIVPGTWYHLTTVYGNSNGTGVVSAYINGHQAGGYTTGILPIAKTTNNLALGYNPAYSGDYFNGSLAEFAIYSYALSPDQILKHYNSGIGVV